VKVKTIAVVSFALMSTRTATSTLPKTSAKTGVFLLEA
jgi:hypothetical protein